MPPLHKGKLELECRLAHDLIYKLSVIVGNCDLLVEGAPEDSAEADASDPQDGQIRGFGLGLAAMRSGTVAKSGRKSTGVDYPADLKRLNALLGKASGSQVAGTRKDFEPPASFAASPKRRESSLLIGQESACRPGRDLDSFPH
jgi:hypothetical protein